ncbi:MAG: Jag N-terminal domain-containing protein [Desulfovibrionales bacterium]|nr:Jag N-terminal domain-containing protein [Desulfovibrionales bacterium]
MEEYVEFTGKDVDDAIAGACRHFNLDRDKLEIEIVSGGSSGIFGLVGVKKARVMAKKRTLINSEEADNNQQEKKKPKEKPKAAKKEHPAKEVPKAKTKVTKADTQEAEPREQVSQKKKQEPQPVHGAEISVNDQTKPIGVIIKDESTSEILIGRDGQTLSAIQYIANRIIAKNWPGAARVQVDTEDFLEKQNEKLQQNAQQLASKAKKVGKTMSTRPLSSYHRRIVHMALQNDKKVRTKSKGDGPMKRVLIMPRNRRRKPSQE